MTGDVGYLDGGKPRTGRHQVQDKDTCLLYHQVQAVDNVLGALSQDSPNGSLAVDDVKDLLERARDRMAYYALEHIGEEFDLSAYWEQD